jgi:hypothetical protein
MEELVSKIKAEFEALATDANLQIEKGNKAAGTRARKSSSFGETIKRVQKSIDGSFKEVIEFSSQ